MATAVEQRTEEERLAIDRFVKTYNALSSQAARAEDENNSAAADLHIHLSGLIADTLRNHGRLFSAEDVRFMESEAAARCMQALLLRSMELSGFGDIALSLSATRNLNDDITRARKRIEASRDDISENSENDASDPRVHTNGLYEYVPFSEDEPSINLNDLPGYEEQHRRLMHAYYILDSTNTTDVLEQSDGRPRTKSGANVILYGPPGTGKTAAARAVASSLKLDFAFVNAENLLSAYRSETEKNLRILYHKMRLLVKTTGRNVALLLDEVDGLVKNRKGEISGGDYSLLTRFLTILEPNDGSDNYGIFSLFTTNRLENLDEAFRRRCATVFFGAVKSEESRVRLFRKFFDDAITLRRDREHDVATLVAQWVPGDYARFKRDVAKPMQLAKYLEGRGVSMDEFYETKAATFRKTTSLQGDRRIVVELTPLPYETIRPSIAKYEPITPFSNYLSEYGVVP